MAGMAAWSAVNNSGVTVRTKPAMMNKPELGHSSNPKQLQIMWDPLVWNKKSGGSKTLGYILQEDGQTIYSGKKTHKTFNPESKHNKIYKFKIAAWNIYGLGKFSEELTVPVASGYRDALLKISVIR